MVAGQLRSLHKTRVEHAGDGMAELAGQLPQLLRRSSCRVLLQLRRYHRSNLSAITPSLSPNRKAREKAEAATVSSLSQIRDGLALRTWLVPMRHVR